MRENIKHYVVERVRLYTNLRTLNNHVIAKWNILLLDALKFLHRHDEDHPQISPIAVEYSVCVLI